MAFAGNKEELMILFAEDLWDLHDDFMSLRREKARS
jgi:hypothetical protein